MEGFRVHGSFITASFNHQEEPTALPSLNGLSPLLSLGPES